MVSDGIVKGKAKEPSRNQVPDRLVAAYTNIPQQVEQNAWLMTGYAFFKFTFNCYCLRQQNLLKFGNSFNIDYFNIDFSFRSVRCSYCHYSTSKLS